MSDADTAPRWRLDGSTGQTAECYLDHIDGSWMLLVWQGGELVLREAYRDRESGQRRSVAIRERMIADGWTDPHAASAAPTRAPRTAWLFTRGRESVRLEVRDAAQGVQLVVSGPGAKRAVYDFPDTLAVLVHQAELERHLVGLGFFLEEFITDRRRFAR